MGSNIKKVGKKIGDHNLDIILEKDGICWRIKSTIVDGYINFSDLKGVYQSEDEACEDITKIAEILIGI